MLIEYLGYSFLIIFNVTAVLALLSLPGWISIDERYKKPLFYGVIIEVAVFIVSLASMEYLENTGPEVDTHESNWIALELDRLAFVQPELTIRKTDTTIIRKLGKPYREVEERFKNNPLIANYAENGISIHLDDSLQLGYMSRQHLNELNLFNSLDIQENKEIAHTRISFELQDDTWNTPQSFSHLPFEIRVRFGDHGTQYELWKESAVLYNSVNSRDPETGSTSIDRSRRVNHIIESEESYYLLYIQHADLELGYIHFSLIELKPILALK